MTATPLPRTDQSHGSIHPTTDLLTMTDLTIEMTR
jgi:hypothetical protein